MEKYSLIAKQFFERKLMISIKRIGDENEEYNNYFFYMIKPNLPSFGEDLFEQKITKGLGYEPVRKVMYEKHEDSKIGLQNHLKNMEKVVSGIKDDMHLEIFLAMMKDIRSENKNLLI